MSSEKVCTFMPNDKNFDRPGEAFAEPGKIPAPPSGGISLSKRSKRSQAALKSELDADHRIGSIPADKTLPCDGAAPVPTSPKSDYHAPKKVRHKQNTPSSYDMEHRYGRSSTSGSAAKRTARKLLYAIGFASASLILCVLILLSGDTLFKSTTTNSENSVYEPSQSTINEEDFVSVFVAAGNKTVHKSHDGTQIELRFYGFMTDGKPQWFIQDSYYPAASDINYPSAECDKNYYIYDYYAAKEISKRFVQNLDWDAIDPAVVDIAQETLRSYGLSDDEIPDFEGNCCFLGINDAGCVEIESTGIPTFGKLRTYDRQNNLLYYELYHIGDLIGSVRNHYDANNRLESSKTYTALDNRTVDCAYSIESDGKIRVQRMYQYIGWQRPDDCVPEEGKLYYDGNFLPQKYISSDRTREYYYRFKELSIPTNQVDYLTRIYESLDIPYVLAGKIDNIKDTF